MTQYPSCVIDGRPVLTAGHICLACWADLRGWLTDIRDHLVRDLEITFANLSRSGSAPIGIVVRNAATGLGYNETAGDLLRELHNELGGWVRVLHEEFGRLLQCSLCHVEQSQHAEGPAILPRDWVPVLHPLVVNNTRALADWLLEHGAWIRRHPAADELYRTVQRLVRQAERVVDRRGGKVYLGICSEPLMDGLTGEVTICEEDVNADEDAAGVTCKACGAMHITRERREVMLKAMRAQKLTASEISRAFATYADIDLKVERVRQWHRRGQIYQHPPREGERWPRYRVAVVRRLLDKTISDQKAG